ncbi:glycosyltransferase [Marinobacter sp. F4206]|uniref:glycosyltransferase n=1 Tax=Marinobacter sp. F4206 TaxID=2861777 RepID=UPI001C5FAC96|nr:glycosyltransferase [Marinobacter sp. F4206]MBW4933783.1 glycosyltransferase [Marinobacter sp. F4206]
MRLLREYLFFVKGGKVRPFLAMGFNVLSQTFPFSFLKAYSQGDLTGSLRILRKWRFTGGRVRQQERKIADMRDFLVSKDDPISKENGRREPFNGCVMLAFHSCGAFDPSGYASRSTALAQGLEALGIGVNAVVRPGYPWDLPAHKTERRIRYTTYQGVEFQFWPNAGVSLRTPDSEYIEVYGRLLAEAASDRRASVIHAASNYLNGFAAAKAGALLGITSVYEVRGLWHVTRAFSQPNYRQSEHYHYCEKREIAACFYVDKVVTISEALKRWLAGKGVPESKISVVGNATYVTDVEEFSETSVENLRSRFALPENGRVIGYLGSLVEYEGLDLLIESLARTPSHARPTLLLVGSGKHEGKLRSLSAELGVAEYVIFAGRVERHEVSACYQLMDLVALPRKADLLTRLVPAIKPFEVVAEGRPLMVSESLAEALEGSLDGGFSVVDFDNLDRLDELFSREVTPIDSIPTWATRAAELKTIYMGLD